MDDHVIKAVQPHPLAHLGNYILGVAALGLYPWLSIMSVAIGVLIIAITEVIRRSETFYVTTTGVVREFKFLSLSRTFVEYKQISNIHTNQNIVERIFGIGTVLIDSAGSNEVELRLRHVPHPREIEELIRKCATGPSAQQSNAAS